MIHPAEKVLLTDEVVGSLMTDRGGYSTRAIRFIQAHDKKPVKGWKHRHIGEWRSRRKYISILLAEVRDEPKREAKADRKANKILRRKMREKACTA